MKGCARSALIQLAGYVATAGAVMFLLQRQYALPPAKTLGVSIFAGFFAWLAWSFLAGVVQPLRERASVRDCLSGQRPADGKRVALVGTIDAEDEALRSPLTARDCVAWTYEIYQMRGRAGRQYKATSSRASRSPLPSSRRPRVVTASSRFPPSTSLRKKSIRGWRRKTLPSTFERRDSRPTPLSGPSKSSGPTPTGPM